MELSKIETAVEAAVTAAISIIRSAEIFHNNPNWSVNEIKLFCNELQRQFTIAATLRKYQIEEINEITTKLYGSLAPVEPVEIINAAQIAGQQFILEINISVFSPGVSPAFSWNDETGQFLDRVFAGETLIEVKQRLQNLINVLRAIYG